MKSEYDYFVIEKENLKNKKIFPFQLFIFNPIQKKYTLILNGNRPITKDMDNFISFLLEKGGKLAVLKNQKKTFLQAQSILEAEIPTLKNIELHELEKEHIMYLKLREMYEEKNGGFAFQNEFEIACQTDSFEKIIERARVEVLTFKVTTNYTTSFAIQLGKLHLVKDNYLNRIVSTCYFLAKTMNIKEEEALADIIVGAYLLHIGLTQITLSTARKAFLNMNESERKNFKKHTILSNHLLRRGSIDLSERCKKIIFDHHERTNGNGYPAEKSGDSIETLALLVGAVTHLFEYSSGKINGSKQPMKSVILAIKNKAFSPGLELDFGDKINESIVNLINTEKIENNKAA
jgi:response regulator RpfG family c-di-GMP phosphodiesterase